MSNADDLVEWQPKGCVTAYRLLLHASILGGFFGYFLWALLTSGWLHPWQRLEPAPEQVANIIAVNASDVWVEGSSGQLYHLPVAAGCQRACWEQVDRAPTEAEIIPGELGRSSKACTGPPPLLGTIEQKAECRRGTWTDSSSVVGLRSNGRLYTWQWASGREWVVIEILLCVTGGEGIFLGVVMLNHLWNRRKEQRRHR